MEMCTRSHDEIVHINSLSDDIKALYLNDDYSDVTLRVEGESFKAHKVILAARSEYFRALLYGGMRESSQTEISLCVSNVVAFKSLLKYIYTGRLSLATLEDVTLDILGLAHQYGFQNLEKAICDFFIDSLSTQNVFSIYDAARLYQLKNLTETCKTYIDQNIPSTLASHTNSFLLLSAEGLKEIIERHSFYAPELEIFKIVLAWCEANNMKGTPQLQHVLSAVRFELMSLEDLCTVVRPSGLVASETILDALEQQTSLRCNALRYRGTLNVNVNMAEPCWGTQVLQGEMKSALLDGNTMNYDMENGYTRHSINDVRDSIIIKLGSQCIVNHIKMLLWDKDLRSYSYYIEVSIDKKDWVRVIDHTNYYCRSWQKLYFEPRVVNYIRIVGTYNTVNPVFHIVALEVMYSTDNFVLVDGLIKPLYHNVATTKESASVIEGVCRTRNSLLDGNLVYDWNNGYTCHQIGSGAILVQLGQPYMIDSMSLLLWDRDDRSYRYYVEVSVNKKNWEIVWDKREEDCQSWQLIVFPIRPVVFIRIIGTNNTANEVFHLVHIECPSMMCTKETIKKQKYTHSQEKEEPKSFQAREDSLFGMSRQVDSVDDFIGLRRRTPEELERLFQD
ncbi:BTB/POZ domain-containing protein 9 isoform X2 [Cimex lectularius]|uniref:BTB domain-containing protein n=1 Tax=Cimex lectularius TaxID=79782 RepID=A0A8I6SMG7_CIMLE|nr:BTB/POZ domain-containing protein 9 isoform X2 [Cimex lectularius]